VRENELMRVSLRDVATAVLAVCSCHWAGATVRTAWQFSEPRLVVPAEETSEERMRESLRGDMQRHPSDFVAFPTETEAIRFMKEHSLESSRETAQRMLELGVVGYWQGRTLVVLPISASIVR
jgi:hypothetical protein